MINEPEKRLQRILQQLDKDPDIPIQNKEHIKKFVSFLNAEGKAKTKRQIKYVFLLKRLSKMLKKDFRKANKQDIMDLINVIDKSKSLLNKKNPKPLSDWTKHDYRVTLKRFYRWLREDEGKDFGVREYPVEVKWFSANVQKKTRRPRQVLDEEDLRKLLNGTTNNRDRFFIYFLYESGCRIGEIVSLRLKDIIENDQYGKKITVFGKTGDRTIRICDSAPALDIWLREHPRRKDVDAPLFCGINGIYRGKAIGDNYFRILLHNIGKKAGIKKPVNPHFFRHSAASRYAHTLTDAQLNDYFGWYQGSKQAGTYVHSIGARIDDAILAMHGKKKIKKENEEKQPKICPRCKTVNDYIANVCQVCNLGLDKKTIMEYDEQQKEAARVGLYALDNPEMGGTLGKGFYEEIKKLKDRIEELEKK